MKTRIFLSGLVLSIAAIFSACNEFEPTGYEEVPNLPKAENVQAQIDGFDIMVTWKLPARNDITDVLFIRNANNENPIHLGPTATSYLVKGQPMGMEGLYTVKICYGDRYVSQGVTASAVLPEIELPGVTNLTYTTSGRRVSLKWTNPTAANVTGVRIVTNGDEATALYLPQGTSEFTLKAQPMDIDLTYDVQAMYEEFYPSVSSTVSTKIPYITPKMGYLMTASSIAELPDDDERAAATWFVQQPDAELVYPQDLASLDPDICPVLWIMVDRVGLPLGWENLPAILVADETIDALKTYSSEGGSLYLSNMATQLTVPLGIVPENMAPTVYGNGDGGPGEDIWTINPQLGFKFKDGGDEGYYDRTLHAIYQGITMEDPNGYGYLSVPLIGPGMREDHNCLWDCNLYGKNGYPDVISYFEAVTGSLVLATWGHVVDHCVAGLVEFMSTPVHGRCIANGFAAYEWNQNSGTNPYQHNLEQLTTNILNYLK